jgi:DNA-binding LacI/PurR family transcriptional regulator
VAQTKAAGRRATSTDVARAAGVSRATVSFVLNDTPGQSIPSETRRRVLDAARSLRYQPSAAARALRSGRSDLVLFLMPNWSTGEIVARTMDMLSQEFSAHGMTFLVHPRAESNHRLADLWRTITPAVVVTVDPLEARDLATLEAAGIAHVTLGLDAPGPDDDISQEQLGRIQAEHLVGIGHTRLGYATTPDASLAAFAAPRLRGVRQVCEEHGLVLPVVQAVVPGPASAAAVGAWHADAVTAVAAYNDEVALAVLAATRDARVAVPDELSVVGVDDIAAAALAAPPLTTVRVDTAALVPGIVASILRRVDRGGDAQPRAAHRPELVVRSSTRARA